MGHRKQGVTSVISGRRTWIERSSLIPGVVNSSYLRLSGSG
ncbi:hypothetical protein MTO96_017492, partial [Rhipicephalus appendiculatus]